MLVRVVWGVALAIAIMGPAVLWAGAPTNVTVDYDGEGMLHVTAQHPTDRLERYYLRTLEIYNNDVLDKTVTFPRQKAAWGMDEFVPYEAKAGDRLKVIVYASEGGSSSADMVVPLPKPNAADASIVKESL